MKIKVTTLTVNGQMYKKYPYGGDNFINLDDRLKAEFSDQGDFYQSVYDVDRQDAYDAGWHPEDKNFCNVCMGWKKFCAEKGKINKTEKTESVSLSKLLFEAEDKK